MSTSSPLTLFATDADSGVLELLSAAGIAPAELTVNPLPGGRNNRVFRVHTRAGVYLLKHYFHHPQDSRDRLGHEIAFLRHLEQTGCRFGPRVLAALPERHAALLEFIVGTRLGLEDITAPHVAQAIEFFKQANAAKTTDSARALPIASEACFSIAEHLDKAQRRIDRLDQIATHDALDAAADRFARQELRPAWVRVRARIDAQWPDEAARAAPLLEAERCLSPSDFGFHNALRESTGRLRFLDFEYAGWDDPAKLICDFANQPDMPPSRAQSLRFAEALIASSAIPDTLARRFTALEPLYQIKWACICLNDFLAAGRSRHRFTDGAGSDHRARRELQLGRARQMLARATATLR